MMVEVDGHMTKVHGAVLLMLADTLAAHQLGGFKVGVGFALRKCRSCMATWEDMQTKVYSCISCFPLYILTYLRSTTANHYRISLFLSSLRKTFV